MNKFKRLKQTNKFSYNEDSSDYISNDEGGPLPKTTRFDSDSIYEGNSNSHFGTFLGDDNSNDSFTLDHKDEHMKNSTLKNQSTQGLSKLNECLDYLHRMIVRKDKEGIFEYAVTDDIAPGYSLIIKHPMDLGTMKKKVENSEYTNIMEYKDDVVVMCENCMNYNKGDTIYYVFAKKMLDYCFKLLSRERLFTLRTSVRCFRYLTSDDLGFSLDASDLYSDHNVIRNKKHAENKLAVFKVDPNLILQNVISNEPENKDSWLISAEGNNDESVDEEEANEMLWEIKQLAKNASQRLSQKNPNGKMGFLRRNSNGTTGYHVIEHQSSESESSENSIKKMGEKVKTEPSYHIKETDSDEKSEGKKIEKAVTIGNLMMGLQAASYSMNNYVEEKKDKKTPIYFLETGPFSSQAPNEDTTFKNIPKEDLNILTSVYGDEFGYQYALSLMEYSKDTSGDFHKFVKTILNELSCNEHEKYLKYITNKNSISQSTPQTTGQPTFQNSGQLTPGQSTGQSITPLTAPVN